MTSSGSNEWHLHSRRLKLNDMRMGDANVARVPRGRSSDGSASSHGFLLQSTCLP